MRATEVEPGPRRLKLLALTPLRDGFAASLARRLSLCLPLPVGLVTPRLGSEPARVPGREQWDARLLLADLQARAAERDELRLAVTAHDLAVPVFSFVFGLAQEHGTVALVSVARLDPAFYGLPPDAERTLTRALGEALHELAHLAGLKHCEQARCLMRFAGTLDKADARGQAFCPRCCERLPAWLRVTVPRAG